MTGRLQALRRVHPLLLVIGAVLLLLAALAAMPYLLMAAPGAAGAVYLARKHKPSLPVRHFLRSRGAGLTLIAGITSALAISALSAAYGHTILLAVLLAALALAGMYLSLEIVEEKIMKPIMSLVPQGQQDALSGFLSGSPAASTGGTADLSGLDPVTVTQAIKARVIGQDAAVDASVSLIFRRSRLRRPAKPVCTLLYVGATGAGKTELAKALSESMFGGRLIRVDCAEYRLIQRRHAEHLAGW